MKKLADISQFEHLQQCANASFNAAMPVPVGPLPSMREPKGKLDWTLSFQGAVGSEDLKKLVSEREQNIKEYAAYSVDDLNKLVNFFRIQLRDAHNANDTVAYEIADEQDSQVREALKRKK